MARPHTLLPHQIFNGGILGLFSKHFLLSKKPKQTQMKADTLSIQLGAVMFIPVEVFGSVILSLHKSTRSNQTLCQEGDARRFGGKVRFTPFVLACWDQWSWSLSHKLTDGSLLQRLEPGQSSWFLTGHERQSATPVTAGRGHHHTSETWGHTGDAGVWLQGTSCSSILSGAGVFLLKLPSKVADSGLW